MKKQKIVLALAIAGLTAAFAANATFKGPLTLNDTDGDGVISAEEIRSQIETRSDVKNTLKYSINTGNDPGRAVFIGPPQALQILSRELYIV